MDNGLLALAATIAGGGCAPEKEAEQRLLSAGPECEAAAANCFMLWNGCTPFSPEVIVVLRPGNDIGLQRADIESAAESRLRAAGVYGSSHGGAFWLSVVLGARGEGPDGFTVELSFSKNVSDDYGNEGRAQTWSTLPVRGDHGGRASEVVEVVRRELDAFMNGYLQVNEPACNAR